MTGPDELRKDAEDGSSIFLPPEIYFNVYASESYLGRKKLTQLKSSYLKLGAYVEAINDGYYFSCWNGVNPGNIQANIRNIDTGEIARILGNP